MNPRTTVLWLIMLLVPAGLNARILHVPTEYGSIQAGINASFDGDTVLVDPGTYNTSINFGGRQITVASQFLLTGDDTYIDITIINGDGGYPLATFANGEMQSAQLVGFRMQYGSVGIILNGYCMPILSHLEIQYSSLAGIAITEGGASINLRHSRLFANHDGIYVNGFGGGNITIDTTEFDSNHEHGVYLNGIDFGSISFHRCMFFDHEGYAVYNAASVSGNDFMTFENCGFNGNMRSIYGPFTATDCDFIGSYVCLEGSVGLGDIITVTNCTFSGCSTIFKPAWQVIANNCDISYNYGPIASSGFVGEDPVIFDFNNCTMTNNQSGMELVTSELYFYMEGCVYAENDGSVSVQNQFRNISITNNTFADNTSNAIEASSQLSNIIIRNNIVAENTGAGISIGYYPSGGLDIGCNDVFNNSGGNYVGISDQTGYNGNISRDPRFCPGNYNIFDISPCHPDSSFCGLIGALPVDCYVFPHCDIVEGDANGNEIFNGMDVSYSVNYLKGMGAPPLDICDCGRYGRIYAAADANGNCEFNGMDVTYSVNYLKGYGRPPRRCSDCP